MNNINKEAKDIATKLNIDHKINSIAEQPAFIRIKDHKPNITTNPTYRLINLSKSKIGKISKHTLDNINTQLRKNYNLTNGRTPKLSPTGSQLYPTRTTQPSSNSTSQTSTPSSENTHLTEP